MGAICDRITEYCVCNGIVDDDNVPWLRYCIEKRIATLLCGLPCFLIAVVLLDMMTAASFFVGFFQMRKKAGGFHAKTIIGCVCASISVELVFVGVFSPRLNLVGICIVNLIDAVVFFLLAPHNHPNMHLSVAEVIDLKKSARMSVVALVFVSTLSQVIGLFSIANGLTTGATMAATMLCTAYINDWRLCYEKQKKKGQCSLKKSYGEDDSP